MHSYINICPCMHICVCVCIYRAPNYPGRPHPEGGVGGEPKKKGGTQNSSETQRISRKCGALLAVLTGNLRAAGSITLASQGRGGDWSRQRATSSCLKSKKSPKSYLGDTSGGSFNVSEGLQMPREVSAEQHVPRHSPNKQQKQKAMQFVFN